MDTLAGVAELDRRFGIPGVASVREGNGAMPRVQITSSLCEAEMYLHGAQVTSWKPAGSDEVLFLSAKVRWTDGQAIRGGIPICFPWFRAKANDPQAPAHGFVRTRAWQLESILEEDDAVVVTMVTESGEHTRHWWPGEFRLVHRATFGSQLKLELVCTNTGTTPLRFEEALHTYNRVSDVQHVRLHGLDTVSFLDNTDSNNEKAPLGGRGDRLADRQRLPEYPEHGGTVGSQDATSNSAGESQFAHYSRVEPVARRSIRVAGSCGWRMDSVLVR